MIALFLFSIQVQIMTQLFITLAAILGGLSVVAIARKRN